MSEVHSTVGVKGLNLQPYKVLATHRALNLRYASTIRISKILSVDKRIIERKLGTLAAPDLAKVESSLCAALRLNKFHQP